jgi:hypothetical protein
MGHPGVSLLPRRAGRTTLLALLACAGALSARPASPANLPGPETPWPLPTLFETWPGLEPSLRQALAIDSELQAARRAVARARADRGLRAAEHRLQGGLRLQGQGEWEDRSFAGGQSDRGAQGRLLFDLALRRTVFSWGRQAARMEAADYRLAAAERQAALAGVRFLQAWLADTVQLELARQEVRLADARLQAQPPPAQTDPTHVAPNRNADLRRAHDRLARDAAAAQHALAALRHRYAARYGAEPPEAPTPFRFAAPEPEALATAARLLDGAAPTLRAAAAIARLQARAARADAQAEARAKRPSLTLVGGASQEDRRDDLLVGEERFRQFAYAGLLVEWPFLDGGAARHRAELHRLEAERLSDEEALQERSARARIEGLKRSLEAAWADWPREPAAENAAPAPDARAEHIAARERNRLALAKMETEAARQARQLQALEISTRAALLVGRHPSLP